MLDLPAADMANEAPPRANLLACPALRDGEPALVVPLDLLARREGGLRDGIGLLDHLSQLIVPHEFLGGRGRRVHGVVSGEVLGLEVVRELLAKLTGEAAEVVRLDAEVGERVSDAREE